MSTEDEDRIELPAEAEALLADWPLPERDALTWDLLAEKTTALALERGVGSVDPALLAPPLPRDADEPGEDPASPGSIDPPEPADDAGPSDLAAIARATIDATRGARGDAEIAREGFSVAAEARLRLATTRPATEAGDPPDTPLTDVETVRSQGAPTAARVAAPHPRVVELPPPLPGSAPVEAPHPRRAAPVWIASALAAAAVLVVLVRSQESPVATAEAPAAAERVAPRETAASSPGQAPAPPASANEPESPAYLALDDLPTEAEARRARTDTAEAPAGTVRATTRSLESKPGKASAATGLENIVLEEEPEAKPSIAAGGPSQPEMRPAAQPTDVPQRPSTGAVQAAVGSVMPSAQACLVGQSETSKATLTFGSDGRVQSVQIAGPAAGTPAESCIRQKLSAARLPPFAEPSFAASISVRPP
jgi:hypothetical protein